MAPPKLSAKSALGYKFANKDRRKTFHINQKRARDTIKRDARFARKREEAKNPELGEQRRARNKPFTIDSKRKWDDIAGDDMDPVLGQAIDLEEFSKRRRLSEFDTLEDTNHEEAGDTSGWEGLSDADSMLEDSEEEDGEEGEESKKQAETNGVGKKTAMVKKKPHAVEIDTEEQDDEADDIKAFSDDEFVEPTQEEEANANREQSPTGSIAPSLAQSIPMSTTSTRLDLTPESLIAKFPALFNPTADPKVLITTSLNSNLHDQARILTTIFPNSSYVRRTAHRFGHKYSVREISKFAANRDFTTLIILMEDQKRPCGLDVVHLPAGPMFHFSITNWVDGRRILGHGNATDHNPELIIHNFKTPLGVLTAALFQSMFPAHPELQGRQVVTMHNQRDYIFVRRHRYVFRDKRATEKSVVDAEGKPIKGVEDIRAGLQELGPRFTLKLRRVDKAIQKASGQEWTWKGKTDRIRTKFQL
ncbi:Brix-domain-containing protein [Microthyrium microscopicum]|uniref:Brix-domain-containing protein n=1 Tax=Microthyrium microscopicum TaxID=703497 RepID=A0A6A6UDQ5_9PEZI|nr:Brix-domain-containing protein [Microthyrium microscopicum]